MIQQLVIDFLQIGHVGDCESEGYDDEKSDCCAYQAQELLSIQMFFARDTGNLSEEYSVGQLRCYISH